MTEIDPRRRDDVVVAQIAQSLTDHIDRYERDFTHTGNWRKAMDSVNDRQSEDIRNLAESVRLLLNNQNEMKITMEANTKLLMEIVPNYRRGMWAVTLFIGGVIAWLVKVLCGHIKWN